MLRQDEVQVYLDMLKQDEGWTPNEARTNRYTEWWSVTKSISGRTMHVFVGFNGGVMSFQSPMGGLQVDSRCERAMYQYLLQINLHTRLIKFAMDEHLYMYMTAEVLRDHCPFDVFKRVFQAFGAYYAEYFPVLELLSTDTAVASTYLALNARALPDIREVS